MCPLVKIIPQIPHLLLSPICSSLNLIWTFLKSKQQYSAHFPVLELPAEMLSNSFTYLLSSRMAGEGILGLLGLNALCTSLLAILGACSYYKKISIARNEDPSVPRTYQEDAALWAFQPLATTHKLSWTRNTPHWGEISGPCLCFRITVLQCVPERGYAFPDCFLVLLGKGKLRHRLSSIVQSKWRVCKLSF